MKMPLDKREFPFFIAHTVSFLDNAATTQKPQIVIEAISNFYAKNNAPVHRGIYALAERATELYEGVRAQTARWLNAREASEIVFTASATESINIVAQSWAMHVLKAGDEILVSELEHHANLVVWQAVAQKTGARLVQIPINHDGSLQYEKLPLLVTSRTKLVAVSHSSNVFGVVVAIEKIIAAAKKVGAKVLIDASQTVPRRQLDVQKLDCDFLVFSSHKMLGPTGVGILYIARELHEQIIPVTLGGGMVYAVEDVVSTWRAMPQRLEAGTRSVADVIGFGAALEYLQKNVDFVALQTYEAQLCARFVDGVRDLASVKILGNPERLSREGHLVSFTVDGVHPHDAAAFLDSHGICVRAGHHCAQPVHKRLGLEGSLRASFYCYTAAEDVDRLIVALHELIKDFQQKDYVSTAEL